MNIHEYQAKQLLRQFGVPVPNGQVAHTPEEAIAAANALTTAKVVVKAQIHAGGRGKGGGVKVVDKTDAAVKEAATAIIGMQLVTHQTGPEGKKVKCVLVEEGSQIAHEYYLSIVLDRARSCPILMVSREGGMDIEEVAEHAPEKLLKLHIHPTIGLQAYQIRQACFFLQLPAEAMKSAHALMSNLYKLYLDKDCSLVEINPMVLTADNRVVALDAKLNFDSNALFRHPDVMAFRDLDEEDPLEVEASKYNLNYIKLEGSVGCMVNGAGLAMASMDIIKLAGAAPANFLDVGGSANAEMIENAFRILLSDTSVKAVLINIFGGILRCDRLAEGVVAAAEKLSVKVPIVIRMKGTNVDQGKAILAASPLKFMVAETMKEAADKVAAAVLAPVG